MEVEKIPLPKPENGAKGNKTKRFELRLTPEEWATIEAKAKESGHTATKFIRRAALGLEVKQKVPVELKRVISAMSNNLNQYLKLAHTGRLNEVDETALGNIIQALNRVLR